ncbi:hypothetical protein IMCC1989_2118 [gamma proteobacterium IMCC1989]|nr:hypothetical protein IMCC1989_2118 [gamma proteobacterium IMCC1989]
MPDNIIRSKRLRKKLHLDEFAIIGFSFTCRVTVASPADYETFFKEFATLVNARHLYIDLDGHDGVFDGRVTSADRYGNASEEDRVAIETMLNDHSMVSDVTVGGLVDACYGM